MKRWVENKQLGKLPIKNSMNKLHTPDQFKTPSARIGMGATGLVLTYLLVTRAIDTGSLWQYTGSFVLVFLSIRLIFRGKTTK